MKKAKPIEVRCDACGGTGRLPVRQPRPGRRIYPRHHARNAAARVA
jgi:hypothetical protein